MKVPTDPEPILGPPCCGLNDPPPPPIRPKKDRSYLKVKSWRYRLAKWLLRGDPREITIAQTAMFCGSFHIVQNKDWGPAHVMRRPYLFGLDGDEAFLASTAYFNQQDAIRKEQERERKEEEAEERAYQERQRKLRAKGMQDHDPTGA